jgi:hypothetical protein
MLTPADIESLAADLEDLLESMGYTIKGHELRRLLAEEFETCITPVLATPGDWTDGT